MVFVLCLETWFDVCGWGCAAAHHRHRISIVDGSPAAKGFGIKPQIGQALISLQDGFAATRQDVTGLGEAEVGALISASGRPLVLTFKDIRPVRRRKLSLPADATDDECLAREAAKEAI